MRIPITIPSRYNPSVGGSLEVTYNYMKMLKFFRRIRQQLLTENKFSKYLLYAIGEIVLVVLGILIALSINNWNEERKGKIEEKKLIKNINQEFTYNLRNLDSVNLRIDNTTKSLSVLLLSMSDSTSSQFSGEKLDSLLMRCSHIPKWRRSDLIIGEIESKGQLGKLINEELKYLIYEWTSELQYVIGIEKSSTESNQSYIDYIMKNGSWREIDKYLLIKEGGSTLLPSNDHLLKDYRFENVVDDHLVWLRHKKNSYKRIRKHVQKIIEASAN